MFVKKVVPIKDMQTDYTGPRCDSIIDDRKIDEVDEVKIYCEDLELIGGTLKIKTINTPRCLSNEILDNIQYLDINGTVFVKGTDDYYEIKF